jgi:hypothetical protein
MVLTNPDAPDLSNAGRRFTSLLKDVMSVRKPVYVPLNLPGNNWLNILNWPMDRNFADHTGFPDRQGMILYEKDATGAVSGFRLVPCLEHRGLRGGGLRFMGADNPLVEVSDRESVVYGAGWEGDLGFGCVISFGLVPGYAASMMERGILRLFKSENPVPGLEDIQGTGSVFVYLKALEIQPEVAHGLLEIRVVVTDDGGTVVVDMAGGVLYSNSRKTNLIQITCDPVAEQWELYIDGELVVFDSSSGASGVNVNTVHLGNGFDGVVDNLGIWNGLTPFEDTPADAGDLRAASGLYGIGPDSEIESAMMNQESVRVIEETVRCRITHIFGGGQRSFIEKLTENVQAVKADLLAVVPFGTDVTELYQAIVNGKCYEITGVQNAGGHNHHLQVFLREAAA